MKWKRLPLPSSLSTQIRPPISSTSRDEIVRPSPVPSRCCNPASVCWNSSKIRSCVLARDPGAGVGDRDVHLLRRLGPPRHRSSPPGGVNFDRVRQSRLKIDLANPPLVAVDDVDVGRELERDAERRSRTRAPAPSRPRARAPRAARSAPTSSSTCPASTLDRSRTSLISESRWFPDERMSSRYSSCFSLIVAEHLLAQHLREADDGVQRRAQLVRHVREELALVPARRLELAVQSPQLVVHPVDVRARASRARRGSARRAGRRSRRPRSLPAAPPMRRIGPISDHASRTGQAQARARR